eukprot:scaffold17996_cov55-Cyclotella_meneghiniana.AAC.5
MNTTSSSLMLLLFFIVLVQSTHLLQASHTHVSSFIHPTRSLASFVDNNSKRLYSMSSSSGEEVMSDADAYHEMVAAAVDLTNAHVTNGMLSAHNNLTIYSNIHLHTVTRSVRDIDTNSRRSFLYNIPLRNDYQQSFAIPPPTELPSKIKARIPCES